MARFASPAAERWRTAALAWDIPAAIRDAAPRDPWGYSTARFAAADDDPADTPSMAAAAELLGTGGVLLDVGCGGGRSSLPLGAAASAVVGVDIQEAMLAQFAAAATRRGVVARTVAGQWPDVAPAVGDADVVVCHHVAYNVPDVAPFLAALDDHARRGVVLEVTAVHPQQPLAWLWAHFWGLTRPDEPTAALLVDVVAADRAPVVTAWRRPTRPHPGSRPELLAEVRRRLCLGPERDAELDALLPADPVLAVEDVVTIAWTTAG